VKQAEINTCKCNAHKNIKHQRVCGYVQLSIAMLFLLYFVIFVV